MDPFVILCGVLGIGFFVNIFLQPEAYNDIYILFWFLQFIFGCCFLKDSHQLCKALNNATNFALIVIGFKWISLILSRQAETEGEEREEWDVVTLVVTDISCDWH